MLEVESSSQHGPMTTGSGLNVLDLEKFTYFNIFRTKTDRAVLSLNMNKK